LTPTSWSSPAPLENPRSLFTAQAAFNCKPLKNKNAQELVNFS